MAASISSKGKCHDNAPMERFSARVKNELTHHQQHYETRAHSKTEIRE